MIWDGEYCSPSRMMQRVSLWKIWSAIVIWDISPNKLPRVSCISGTFCGAPREKVRSYKLFLEYVMGSWKIQKYVSVVLISSRGAIALIHPKLSYLWWRRCLATIKPSSLSSEDTPLTSLVKKCTCTYMQYNEAHGCLPAHAPSSLVMDKERLLYPPDMAP